MQPLVNMAAFLLAVNLAYLRFETFEHRERIKQHALEQWGASNDVPDDLKKSDYYKRLSYWAGISQDSQAVKEKLGWRGWYQFVFDAQHDRQAATIMVWTALPVVLAGTADVSGLIRIPSQTEWIGWLLATLELMTAVSVALVLSGNRYISTACTLIDKDAEQWKIVMRDQTPKVKTRTRPLPHTVATAPWRPTRS